MSRSENIEKGIEHAHHNPLGGAGAMAIGTLQAFSRVEWIVLTIGSILCGCASVWICSLLGIPGEPHFSGSLLVAAPVLGVVVSVIAIFVSLMIGSLTAASVEREAGLFCGCLGVAALGVRCGAIRPVLQYAGGPGVFISLALEAAILGVILLGGWIAVPKLLGFAGMKKQALVPAIAPNEVANALVGQKLTALGLQMVVMGIAELIVIQSDAKAQAMAGVFVAAYLGSLAAYLMTPLSDGIWYWTGPMCVAVIGYLLAYFTTDGIGNGDVHGWSAALARATPLDYAGMGTAGALLGYWSIRRWTQPEESPTETVTGQ